MHCVLKLKLVSIADIVLISSITASHGNIIAYRVRHCWALPLWVQITSVSSIQSVRVICVTSLWQLPKLIKNFL